MSKALRVPDYLGHILQAIERISRYTADLDEVGFLRNEMAQDAVIRNIEIIGEASNNILRAFPGWSCTRCATGSRTATTRWTWKSSGGRFNVTCRPCTGRCRH